MKSPIEVIIGLKEFEDSEEFQRLKAIKDREAQGYASAPYLVNILGMTPEELLQSLLDNPAAPKDAVRDAGVRRWCNDNMAASNGPH